MDELITERRSKIWEMTNAIIEAKGDTERLTEMFKNVAKNSEHDEDFLVEHARFFALISLFNTETAEKMSAEEYENLTSEQREKMFDKYTATLIPDKCRNCPTSSHWIFPIHERFIGCEYDELEEGCWFLY